MSLGRANKMCGIFGFVGKFEKDTMRELFIKHESKGSDATGCALFKDRSLLWLKNPMPARQFIKTKAYREIESENPWIMICHTRAATQGDKSDNKNNHPFINKEKLLALVHNGIISNYRQIVADLKVDGECDSEVILALLSKNLEKNDVLKAVEKTVNSISGFYNFAFIYKQKLYIYSDGNIKLIKHNSSIYFVQAGASILGERDGLFLSLKSLELKRGRLAIIELKNGSPCLQIRKLKIVENSYYDNGSSYLDYYQAKSYVSPAPATSFLIGSAPRYCSYMKDTCYNPVNCNKCELRGYYIEPITKDDVTDDYSD